MSKKSFKNLALLMLSAMPMIVLAQGNNSCSSSLHTVGDFFLFLTCLINRTVIPLLFAIAIMVFIFGVVKYITNSSDETAREEGRKFMFWSVIALFVMLSVWGLVGVLRNTFGVNGNFTPQLPEPSSQ